MTDLTGVLAWNTVNGLMLDHNRGPGAQGADALAQTGVIMTHVTGGAALGLIGPGHKTHSMLGAPEVHNISHAMIMAVEMGDMAGDTFAAGGCRPSPPPPGEGAADRRTIAGTMAGQATGTAMDLGAIDKRAVTGRGVMAADTVDRIGTDA